MPTNPEAPRLNLEYYRKQAKALLKQARSAEPEALQRLLRNSPDRHNDVAMDPSSIALHQAQLTVAREQGFPSWPKLQAYITRTRLDSWNLAQEFVTKSLVDLRQAEDLLARAPRIAHAGLYPALVLGEVDHVADALCEAPELAQAPGGPNNWAPLLYVCFSRYAQPSSGRSAGLLATARLLLEHGADPNAAQVKDAGPDNPLSCLYAASGLNNNPDLTLALLQTGANPDDGESVYHSTEHPDLACLRLLLAHGATVRGTNGLKHMLDREDAAGLQLFLDAGADPNETNGRGETALHWAVWRGRGAGIIEALLNSGASIDARRTDGRTAYVLAVQSGQQSIAALLEARGADLQLNTLDRFLAACQTAGEKELEQMLAASPEIAASPENERLLPDLATGHRTAAVRALLAAGLPVDARGENGATALHWACWRGFGDIARLLLEHGASLAVEDEQFHATPPGWFGHGSRFCDGHDGDYAEVARVLIEYGATIPAVDMPTGRPDVDAVLRAHGLIE
ncbi:ankyrin repeat domain-containing protein [uncultured Paludibaculum sp.]|uniref:ankyrin repeat domain-containing protein n=1 Tax=uncultured Paludibaculum sp. TaxID=1765020 RepID=UPI002AAA6ADE|nr:ankyrin repeat domain-containing protein [uncultured Paludibaculum sp.]